MKLIKITMVTGEKIIGKLVQEDRLYIYVETKMEYGEMELELFGKEYCEQHSTQVNKLPKDEIRHIEISGKEVK